MFEKLRLGWLSVRGVQTGEGASQFVVFQTPPWSAPMYMTLAFVGSGAATDTRPAMTGPLNTGSTATGAGPIGVQAAALRAGTLRSSRGSTPGGGRGRRRAGRGPRRRQWGHGGIFICRSLSVTETNPARIP